MYEVVLVLLLIVAIAIVALILLQQGKGAGMGASFGAGASNTVFGAAGSGNFLTKSTWFLALIFFALCLLIGYLHKTAGNDGSDFSNIQATQTQTDKATPAKDVKLDKKDVPIIDDKKDTPPVN